MTIGDPYTCQICLGEFRKKRSDEEALNDALTLHGGEDISDVGTVCHDCWLKVAAISGFDITEGVLSPWDIPRFTVERCICVAASFLGWGHDRTGWHPR